MITDTELKKLTDEILEQTFNQRMKDAELLGRLLWHNHTGVYSLNDFENSLINSAEVVLQHNRCFISEQNNSILFIVTEAYMTGGHTRLMERLAYGIGSNVELLITRTVGPEVVKRLSNYFKNIICMPYQYDYKTKVEFIYSIACSYNHIVLNIHPDDVLTTVACGLIKKKNPSINVYYVNHADHVFSYGAGVADIWFQISSFGAKIDDLRNLKGKVSFLGIPIENKCSADNINTENLAFMTAGAAEKYKPINGLSIFPLLYSLLQRNKKSRLHVIGPNIKRDYWWWLIKIRHPMRVKISKRIPFDKYMEIVKYSQICIDSHPIPGGTAFAEQFIQGKICIGLASPFQGYTPVELLKEKYIEDVSCHRQEVIEDEIKKVLQQFHGPEAVKERFNMAVFHGELSPNLCEEYLTWSGDISYDWSKVIKSIPSDFHFSNIITKFALQHSSKSARLFYVCKKIMRFMINYHLIFKER
jgi:hypothetical protein